MGIKSTEMQHYKVNALANDEKKIAQKQRIKVTIKMQPKKIAKGASHYITRMGKRRPIPLSFTVIVSPVTLI